MLFQQDLVENAVPLFVLEAAAVKQELASSRPRLERGYLKVSILQVYCQSHANDVVKTSYILFITEFRRTSRAPARSQSSRTCRTLCYWSWVEEDNSRVAIAHMYLCNTPMLLVRGHSMLWFPIFATSTPLWFSSWERQQRVQQEAGPSGVDWSHLWTMPILKWW